MDAFLLTIIGVVVVAVVVVFILIQTYGRLLRKVGPNQALIVYGAGGTKIITGGSTLVIPLIQRADVFLLDLLSRLEQHEACQRESITRRTEDTHTSPRYATRPISPPPWHNEIHRFNKPMRLVKPPSPSPPPIKSESRLKPSLSVSRLNRSAT